MLPPAWPLPPTIHSIGFLKTRFANYSTFLGKVAENITNYLSGLTLFRILYIYGSNPKSNILSASSITTYVTLLKFVILPLLVVRTSIILPGVHTTISAPLFNSESYPAIPAPPTQQTTFNLRAFVNDLQFEYI